MVKCTYCKKLFNNQKGLNAHLGIKHKEILLDKPVVINSDYLDIISFHCIKYLSVTIPANYCN